MAAQPVTTVVGAGTMGRGIAYVSALFAGVPTRLVDLDPAQLDAAGQDIEHDMQGAVARGIVSAEQVRTARGLLTTSTDLAAGCEGAGLVIEAVVERMEVKHEVM